MYRRRNLACSAVIIDHVFTKHKVYAILSLCHTIWCTHLDVTLYFPLASPSDSKDQGKYTQIQLGLSDNVISALQYENILTSADSILHVKKCSIIQWIQYHVMAIRMDEMR